MKILITILFCVAATSSNLFAQNPDITISRETTFITEPKTDDGFVDIISAINAKFSEGITPENNAAAVIFPVLGSRPEKSMLAPLAGNPMADRFFKELGVPVPANDAPEFISLPNYLITKGINSNKEMYQQILDQQGDAMERTWSRNDYPIIADWLDANQKNLDTIIEGVKREHYYCPINSDAEVGSTGQSLIATLLPHIQAIREVARALSCRALMLTEEGKNEEAWQDLIASYRLGRHIGHGPFLIDTLVGIAIESITNETMLIFIEHTNPDLELTKKYQDDLDSLPPQQSMAEIVDISERLMFIDIVAMLAYDVTDVDVLGIEDGLLQLQGLIKKSRLHVDWNIVLKNANDWYDQFVEAMKIESFADQQKEFARINGELKEFQQKFQQKSIFKSFAIALLDVETRSTYVGEVLVALILPAVTQATIAEYRAQQKFGNLQIAIALAAYHSQNGTYPEQLKELQPEYLKEIPTDVFAEKELNYQKTEAGYLLYSIGNNRTNDGGKSFDERKDDLVVKVPSLAK